MCVDICVRMYAHVNVHVYVCACMYVGVGGLYMSLGLTFKNPGFSFRVTQNQFLCLPECVFLHQRAQGSSAVSQV